ncbi:MAG: O-antigen ligase family protein [Lachnospiraceae bacterium]|nr:O-antigen ligase family protein [Lachnospiraceae bacterium]
MIKKLSHLFTGAYLLLLFCVYPFYMQEGYVEIGEAKYQFFILISFAALVILAVLALLEGMGKLRRRLKEREPYLIRWNEVRISITDVFVVLFALEILFSFCLSDYPEEAFWGTEGWRIGLALLLSLCCLYFAISRQRRISAVVWYAGMAASGAVFLLGILDRFSIYLIPLPIRDPAFISTLGNINWFCGYLTVLAPVGACVYLSAGTAAGRWLSGCYVFLAFLAGFCQGSSSVFLFFGGLFLMLLWISVSQKEWLPKWCFLLAIWGLAGWCAGKLKILFAEGYNYEPDNLCFQIAGSKGMIAVMLLGFAAGLILQRRPLRFLDNQKSRRGALSLLIGIPVTGILLWAALSLINTGWGIAGLKSNPMFLINENWGNGRGATWSAGIKLFGGMDGIRKLFGTGPDCFSAYAYSQPQTAGALRGYFGDSRLTNAHNELLTSLVNLGIVGTFFYFGAFVSGMARCLKEGAKEPYLLIPAVCIFCYLVHNMVSFAQVLNLPYVFVIMAAGEGMLRSRENLT